MAKKKPNKTKYLKKVKLVLENGEYPNLLDNKPLKFPDEISKTFLAMKNEAVETFVCVCLDEKLIIKFFDVIALGDSTEIAVSVKRILKTALMSEAYSLIAIHNHPSGSCQPSEYDLGFIDKLQKVASDIEIKFLDFIIIGDEKFDKKKKCFWSLYAESNGDIKYHPLLDYKKL